MRGFILISTKLSPLGYSISINFPCPPIRVVIRLYSNYFKLFTCCLIGFVLPEASYSFFIMISTCKQCNLVDSLIITLANSIYLWVISDKGAKKTKTTKKIIILSISKILIKFAFATRTATSALGANKTMSTS